MKNLRFWIAARKRLRSWVVWTNLILLSLALPVRAQETNEIELLSLRRPASPATAGGNGDSVAPRITPDGRFILFASTANNLVTNDDNHFGTDVFLHDLDTGTTELVSVNTNGAGGGDGHSLPGMVSANGRHVVFESTSLNLAPLKSVPKTDVFLRDMATGATRLLSRRADGGAGSHISNGSAISPDGHWVAFVSYATNLADVSTNGIAGLYLLPLPSLHLYDVVADTLERLGPPQLFFPTNLPLDSRVGGVAPSFSADGKKLLFRSNATNLVDGVPASGGELYVLDIASRQLTWASGGAAEAFDETNRLRAVSSRGTLSADGRFVVFRAALQNGTDNAMVFHRDLQAAAPVMVTSNSLQPLPANDDVSAPRLSADGRFVAYVEAAPKPDVGSTVRRWDAQTGTSLPVGGNDSGESEAGTRSTSPKISDDGRIVVHLGTATGPATSNVSTGLSLYRHDLGSGESSMIGLGPVGGLQPAFDIAADGDSTVFHSREPVSGDPVGAEENIYAQKSGSLWPVLVSRHVDRTANGSRDGEGIFAGRVSVSTNGRWVAYASVSDRLVGNDDNGQMDVFVFDRARRVPRLVSVGLDGRSALGGASFSPVISGDGRHVAFLSLATNLATASPSANVRLFRHDLWTGNTELVSVGTNAATPFEADVADPTVSPDGRYVAYSSRVSPTSPLQSHWRDMETDTAVTLGTSLAGNSAQPPVMSADGTIVAYQSGGSWRFWHSHGGTNLPTTLGLTGRPWLAPNGKGIMAQNNSQIRVFGAIGGSSYSINNAGRLSVQGTPPWSGDGSRLLAVVLAGLDPLDTNNVADVYLFSATNYGDRLLVSRNLPGTGSGNGASDSPAFSADGRHVVFRTWATDIVPVSGPGPHLVLHDVETGTNRLVGPDSAFAGSRASLVRPILSGAAETLVFSGLLLEPEFSRGISPLAVAFSPLDDDHDGLPDQWERTHFTDLEKDGSEDSDLDGMTDLAEFLAGTDPRDKNSTLRLVPRREEGGPMKGLKLKWSASSAGASRLQSTEDLGNPSWRNVPGGRRWTDGWLEQGLDESATNLFFRVLVDE